MPSRDQFTTEIYVNNEQARDATAKLEAKLEKQRKYIDSQEACRCELLSFIVSLLFENS